MKATLKQIEHLAQTIGPRASATAAERAGHEYVRQQLELIGCATRVESFDSAKSVYWPYMIALALLLGAEAGSWCVSGASGVAVVAVVSVVALVSLLLEMLGMANPLRWGLPRSRSQNVIGVTRAAGEMRQRIAMMAHVDTHRTPWIWRSSRTFRVYLILSTLGMLGAVALTGVLQAGTFDLTYQLRLWSRLPTLVVALTFVMVAQAEFTPWTAGANDNASGVGVVLALAARAQREPLPHTELWWVATGCEEVSAYGSADFVRRHRTEFADGLVLVVDTISGRDTWPTVFTSEKLLWPLRYPANLLREAEMLGQQRPEFGLRFQGFQGAYSDAFHLLKARIFCLTIIGCTRDGWLPHWHQPSDILAHVDLTALARSQAFVWELLRKLTPPTS